MDIRAGDMVRIADRLTKRASDIYTACCGGLYEVYDVNCYGSGELYGVTICAGAERLFFYSDEVVCVVKNTSTPETVVDSDMLYELFG